jgi:hypothetical protein
LTFLPEQADSHSTSLSGLIFPFFAIVPIIFFLIIVTSIGVACQSATLADWKAIMAALLS